MSEEAKAKEVKAKEKKKAKCCSALVEKLESMELTIVDKCPICSIIVGRHQYERELGESIVKKPSSTSTFNPYKGITLPKFNKNSVVNIFMKKLEHELVFNNIDERYWYKSLLKVFDNSVNSESWVMKNIVEPELPWTDAKKKFILHFQNADYNLQLQHQYNVMKQLKNESVQEFGDRFNNLTDELHFSDERLIQDYLYKINTNIAQRYRDEENADRRRSIKAAESYVENDLKSVQDMCISYELPTYSIHASAHVNNERPFSSTSTSNTTTNRSRNKVCVNHPNSNNHNTSECRMKSTEGVKLPEKAKTPTPLPTPSPSPYKSNIYQQLNVLNVTSSGITLPIVPNPTKLDIVPLLDPKQLIQR